MINEKQVIVGLDAMGGDYAPSEHVLGAIHAIEKESGITVLLFGDETRLRQELSGHIYDEERILIRHCESVVDNCDVPTVAIRQKKDSSMVKGLYALREKEADAFVSCGNTGALLVGGQTIVGRIPGVTRAGLAFLLPTMEKPALLIDAGANVDTRPDMLVQFAKMGSIYKGSLSASITSKVGALLVKNEIKKAMRQFSVEEYGGAPMLGLKQFVVKTHGNSKAPEICNTILQCRTAVIEGIDRKIAESLKKD